MKDLNQMADTFFDLSSLNNDEHILPPDEEESLDNEEEYDALNNETFGDLEADFSGDDWEEQHEQFAQFAKTSVNVDKIDDSLNNLMLNDIPNPIPSTPSSVWSYSLPRNVLDEVSSVISSLHKASQSFVQSRLESQINTKDQQHAFNKAKSTLLPSTMGAPQTTPKICTVEELEKNLLTSSRTVGQLPLPPRLSHSTQQQQTFPRPIVTPNHYGSHRPHPHMAPGPYYPAKPPNVHGYSYTMGPNRYSHLVNVPPLSRHMPPPGFRMLPPYPFLQGNIPQRTPLGLNYPYQVNQQPIPSQLQIGGTPVINQHINQVLNHMQPQYQHYPQHQRTYSGRYEDNNSNNKGNVKDEYEGLMSAREKQWLLNIQLLQLNTGTPYFDDYYYTVFKERKAKSNKENNQFDLYKFQNNRQRRNSDRQENALTPKVYTPQQFENSLGKLQVGSVTAPRKIIDMYVVNCDKDSENSVIPKDSRKTKQLLLELEMLYSLFLKAEDITNPMAITNLKVLRDIKQKQRLRELDLATTSEQKQELLELVKKESQPVVENPNDYIQKILVTMLQEDKFTNFMNIRKGKMLLLRILPTLMNDNFFPQVVDIWSKVLLSIPIIGRRDTFGDNLLSKLYPLFKRYIQSVKMSHILDNVRGLTEVSKLENSRSTPLCHQGKVPLYFVLLNKFGISALAALFVRSEYLISTNGTNQIQQNIWFNFIITIADSLSHISKTPTPLEGISQATFTKLCQRISNLTTDRFLILKKHFAEAED